MTEKYFKCTLLSDIVLNPTSATEGSFKSLDYIPGSNFLGIVASNGNYKKFGENAYNIFHSGKVRFNDAHISMDNKRSLKQPAAWFYKKEDKDKENKIIYLHHFISDSERENLIEAGIQLKQVRSGYFVYDEKELKIPKITHNFSIKSAHNIEERRSEEGKMYGYDVLKAGSEWIFSVESDKESLLDDITKYLKDEKHIGRSKTAQYGRVKIEKLDNFNQFDYTDYRYKNELIIYFESCTAFLDEYGLSTFQPTIQDLELDSGEIDWEKSQILIRSYSLWNGERKTRDADRTCIDKGSVIVIKGLPSAFDLEKYKKKIKSGIGIYKNEGFGKILINPFFLTKIKEEHLLNFAISKQKNETKETVSDIVEKDESDETILNYIESEKTKQENLKKVLKATNNFIRNYKEKFKKISTSQWGMVRQIAQRNLEYSKLINDLFKEQVFHLDHRGIKIIDKESGFLRHGKSEKQWKHLWETLKRKIEEVGKNSDEQYARKFLINLCGEMQKRKNTEEKGGKND